MTRHSVSQLSKQRKHSESAERIMFATEALCAERGLESVSMRDIAKAAGISQSVIYHHFDSKIELLKATMYWRLGDLYAIRQPLFEELEAQEHPSLERLLHAVIAPISLLRAKGQQGNTTGMFLARLLISTLPEIKREMDAGAGSLRRLVDLTQRAAPHLSREEVCWRLHFTIGIEHMTHWDYERLELMSDGLCNARSVDESINRAVAFAKAAFEAA